METGLEGKPWYIGLLAGVIVGAVIVYGGYQLKVKSMKQEIRNQETRLADLENQIQRGEEAKAQLPQFQERVGRMEVELGRLLRILPNRRNVHDLLRQFRALADRGSFNIVKVTTGREVEQEYFSEFPITLNIEGTYHNLARFFDQMSRYSRIINVDSLKLSAARRPTPTHSLDVSFVAKTFVYNDDSGDEPELGR